MEIPNVRGHALKILLFIDVDALIIVIVGDFFYFVGAGDGISGNEVIQRRRFHEVQGYQFSPFFSKSLEKPFVRGERQAREVYLEELGIAGAVVRRVEDSIGIVENILRAKGLIKVSLAVFDEL